MPICYLSWARFKSGFTPIHQVIFGVTLEFTPDFRGWVAVISGVTPETWRDFSFCINWALNRLLQKDKVTHCLSCDDCLEDKSEDHQRLITTTHLMIILAYDSHLRYVVRQSYDKAKMA